MRKLLFTLGLFFGACGIKPLLQPFGCDGDYVCVCSDDNCDWVLICKE